MTPGAAPERAPKATGSPIDVLMTLLNEDLNAVDAIIQARMHSPVGMIPNLASYLVNAGGKRIRPMVTLAAARLLGGGGDAPRKLAAAVEFIHTATLLHDDVVDQSSLRRGKKSANLVWGNSASVLVGDFLFARSFNLMVETGDLEVLDILARAASVIAEGEVMQLAAANDTETSEAHYLEIIAAKTAALFAAAARAGAVAAGKPGEPANALEAYGRDLGIAFQLVDDALDYGGRAGVMGKNAGDDFREGKMTLPVILARDEGDGAERDFWRRVMQGLPSQNEGDFETALAILRRRGALTRTFEAARFYGSRAKAALTGLPKNAYADALADLTEFVVDRAG